MISVPRLIALRHSLIVLTRFHSLVRKANFFSLKDVEGKLHQRVFASWQITLCGPCLPSPQEEGKEKEEEQKEKKVTLTLSFPHSQNALYNASWKLLWIHVVTPRKGRKQLQRKIKQTNQNLGIPQLLVQKGRPSLQAESRNTHPLSKWTAVTNTAISRIPREPGKVKCLP